MAPTIIQINFKLNVSSAEYESMCNSVAQSFTEVDGLRWKIWIKNNNNREAGGIYLFESAAAAQAFLAGPLMAAVKNMPALRGIEAKVFDVMADLTAITRGPVGERAAVV